MDLMRKGQRSWGLGSAPGHSPSSLVFSGSPGSSWDTPCGQRGAGPLILGLPRAPQGRKGLIHKQRTRSSVVCTSLYKRIQSSINRQLGPEPSPSWWLGWALAGGPGAGGRARVPPTWGQMRAAWGPCLVAWSWRFRGGRATRDPAGAGQWGVPSCAGFEASPLPSIHWAQCDRAGVAMGAPWFVLRAPDRLQDSCSDLPAEGVGEFWGEISTFASPPDSHLPCTRLHSADSGI